MVHDDWAIGGEKIREKPPTVNARTSQQKNDIPVSGRSGHWKYYKMRSFHRVKPGDESLVVRSLPEPIINKPISQLFSVDSRRYIGARFCRLERFTHGQNLWFEAKVPRILQQILREKAARDSMFQHPPPL